MDQDFIIEIIKVILTSQSTEVIAKAVDSAANVQPENVESVWNLRGVLNTSWHRVLLRLGHSNL
uniref:Moybdenum cofactor oxidoreductase dimerisation domain-containing protein n=1 Tax=Brassica oleracea var. oleracea TaxID=109376 RepID=A0A0D3CAG9_BRAOL